MSHTVFFGALCGFVVYPERSEPCCSHRVHYKKKACVYSFGKPLQSGDNAVAAAVSTRAIRPCDSNPEWISPTHAGSSRAAVDWAAQVCVTFTPYLFCIFFMSGGCVERPLIESFSWISSTVVLVNWIIFGTQTIRAMPANKFLVSGRARGSGAERGSRWRWGLLENLILIIKISTSGRVR